MCPQTPHQRPADATCRVLLAQSGGSRRSAKDRNVITELWLPPTRNRLLSALPKNVLPLRTSPASTVLRFPLYTIGKSFEKFSADQRSNRFPVTIGYPYLASKGSVSSVTRILSPSPIREAHFSSARSRTIPVWKRLGFPETVWLIPSSAARSPINASRRVSSCNIPRMFFRAR